jgi:nickel-dependent lactate racemase
MTTGTGHPEAVLTGETVRSIIEAGTPASLYDNKRVLVLTPDATRTCPLPMLVRAVRESIGRRAAQLDFMVALGTHPPLTQASILKLYGITTRQKHAAFAGSRFLNHRWDRQDSFIEIGTLGAKAIEETSGGLLSEEVSISINKAIYNYDLVLIVGPVFPHEVVGFSGGAKYLFPGISGGDFLHFFHWLGAVITCRETIGFKDTPMRRLIHQAMDKVRVPVHCLALVVTPENRLCGCYAGDPSDAWSAAADLSARVHIVTRPEAYRIVLGRAPEMYAEIWTAGKVMYKLEQVVADGGTLIIHGPHIREISTTWGDRIESIGYHVRDYFLADMARFKEIPRGVLAHSTHVRGTGTYQGGVEKPRIQVVLATSIARATCERVCLGYMNPAEINLDDYKNREDQGIFYVERAGEILHRLSPLRQRTGSI